MTDRDFTVHQYGTDAYGRPVLMTAFMHDWLEHRFTGVGFRLTVAQGAFMSRLGGGAKASQGAHDQGKCVDFIIDGLTAAELDDWIWECRTHGGAAYRRDESDKHGNMPTHCHVTLGADEPGSPMADILWSSYVADGDGLAAGPGRPGGAPDYERRPSPLVLTPPPEEDDVTPEELEAAVTKAITKVFRDKDGGLPDIGNARIVRPDGTTTTLAKVAQEVHNLTTKEK